jgi:hypothetical protein
MIHAHRRLGLNFDVDAGFTELLRAVDHAQEKKDRERGIALIARVFRHLDGLDQDSEFDDDQSNDTPLGPPTV